MQHHQQHPALEIQEILEVILLDLDMNSLLTSAIRVCKSWNSLISHSPALQRHLFFMPEQGDLKQPKRVPNPLLKSLFPMWFCFWDAENVKDLDRFGRADLRTIPLASDERKVAFLYAGATWRKMLTTQPPIKSFLHCTANFTMFEGMKIHLKRITSSTVTKKEPDTDYETKAESDASKYHQSEDGELDLRQKDELLDPVGMGTFYDTVKGSNGFSWALLWNSNGSSIKLNSPFGTEDFTHDTIQTMERGLKADGVLMFQFGVGDCVLSRYHR